MAQGTGTPKVTVTVASGNLQRQVQVLDGVAGIVGTAGTKIGIITAVYSYEDAVAKGYSALNEPFLNAQISQFYNELAGNQKLWIMGVENTMTLTQMATLTNANGAKKLLLAAQGEITMLYLTRNPAGSYVPVANRFLDKDVEDAVTASKTLAQYQQNINKPIRILLDGRTNDLTVEPIDLTEFENTYVGVVLGRDYNRGSAIPIGALALARACKYGSHVKIGNGQNGALSISRIGVGAGKELEAFYPEELDNLSNKGYIIPTRRDGAAGYYFGRDNMSGADDFKILVHGRIVDKAQRIAVATATPLLETTVRVDANGLINSTDAKHLENEISQQLLSQMAGQISDIDVNVPTDVDIINTSTGEIEVNVLPLGYLTWLKVTIGLTSNI